MSAAAPDLTQPFSGKESSGNAQLVKLGAPLQWGLRLLIVALALVIALFQRFAMNVDGISYLDMAYAYMRGDWKMAVNSYWGAGYSWILGVFLAAVRAPMRWESTLVHLVNVLILIVALIAFEYFLTGVIRLGEKTPVDMPGGVHFDHWTWWVVGYLLFLVVSVFITPVTIVTPDLCVAAALLLASGMVLRIAVGSAGKRTYIFLGITLGLGYLIKSPIFPLGLVYLAVAWLAAPRTRRRISYVVLAAVIFLLISTPYILAISRSAGRLTIGENARVTYGHYVLGIDDFSYWMGEVPGLGTPRHAGATRQVMAAPDVYLFHTATGGTLPPYYNPAYWADGLKLRFSLGGELRVLRDSAAELLNLFYYLREYVLVFLIFLFVQPSAGRFLRRLLAAWPVWLPALAAVAMYAPLHVELRFLGAFVLLGWAAFTLALEFPGAALTPRLWRAATLALFILVGYRLFHDPRGSLRQSVPPLQWTVAQSLAQHGLRPGDRVAQMLYHNRDAHYWAHLAGATIVADIPYREEKDFWDSPPAVQRQVEQVLAAVGARFLVTDEPPRLPPGSAWQSIPGTGYAFLPLASPARPPA